MLKVTYALKENDFSSKTIWMKRMIIKNAINGAVNSIMIKVGLKYGIATRPKDNDMIASAESFWEQLERNDLLCKDDNKIQEAKLRGLVFNLSTFTIGESMLITNVSR